MNRRFALSFVSVAASLVGFVGGCADAPHPMAAAGQGEILLIVQPAANVDTSELIPAAKTLAALPGVVDVSAATGRTLAEAPPPLASAANGRAVLFVMSCRPDAGGLGATDWKKCLTDAGYGDKIGDVAVFAGTTQNYQISQQFTEETSAATLQRRAAALQQQSELRARTK